MQLIKQNVPVQFTYNVYFTQDIFSPGNSLFTDILQSDSDSAGKKALFIIDDGLLNHHRDLIDKIKAYLSAHNNFIDLVCDPVVVPGGEQVKNDPCFIEHIHRAVNEGKVDRHSYIIAIGGGAVLDMAGYAASTAHRGIRLIRVPTTVLSQNDSGIGVKNGINAFGKKNFVGTFSPPFAVINDYEFLISLEERDWKAGISEALKVALLKDADFFRFLEESTELLVNRDQEAMQQLVYRCTELHLEHIATSGDPFEMGSSRPLDFGHWSAHKLEQLSGYKLRHGEAVAVGLALDCTYSFLSGMLSRNDWQRVLQLIQNSGLDLFVPELNQNTDDAADPESIFHGLEEFREHLGGKLTIMLLEKIGKGIEVHTVDYSLYKEAINLLKSFHKQPV